MRFRDRMRQLVVGASATALIALTILGTAAAQDELPDEVRAKILKKLEALTETAKESKFGKYTSASSAFEAAAASPAKAYDFYVECYKLVNFDRKGKSFSEFRDWKANNLEWLRSTEHATARQLQLKFLLLTIRYMNLEDTTKIVTPLKTYIESAVAAEKKLQATSAEPNNRFDRGRRGFADILYEGVNTSVFAQAYGLDQILGSVKGWELTPLNVQGHYMQVIIPALHESGTTASIEAAWDHYIQLEGTLVANRDDAGMEEEFKSERLPVLLWSKWSDVADHGGRAKAASQMLSLIERYISHDQAENWIMDLEDVANGVNLSE